MAVYPEKISAALASATFGRPAVLCNATGTSADFECGSIVRFRLLVDRESKKVEDVAYQSNGCGYMVSAAETVASHFKGLLLTEINGFDRSGLVEMIREALGEFPRGRMSCMNACLDALESALVDFRSLQLGEFSGEKALICTCFGVTEERIEELIAGGEVESLEDVMRSCNAGSGCGSCRILIQELLESE